MRALSDLITTFLLPNLDLQSFYMFLDADVIKKIQEIQNLPQKDRDHLFYMMENVLQNVKAKKAFAA